MNAGLKNYIENRRLCYRYKMSEAEYQSMIQAFLKERLGETMEVEVYPQEESFFVEVSLYEQKDEVLDAQMQDLIGSSYWDNPIETANQLNQYFFEGSEVCARYLPETVQTDEPMIEFLINL